MSKHIVIIQGHPDPAGGHFCHALATAYEQAARAAGHWVERIDVAALGLPLLHDPAQWREGEPPAGVAECQRLIGDAQHLVIVYPLWLGALPAVLKGFFEQVFRPGFALPAEGASGPWTRMLKGRSARIVVTMGMPGLFYRWFYRAHSLRSLERNILAFVGIRPTTETIAGNVEGNPRRRERYLAELARLGKLGL